MYVDPSAMLTILKEEPDAAIYRDRLAAAPNKVITVVGKVEAAISLGRAMDDYQRGPDVVDRFCVEAGVTVVPIYNDLYAEAVSAYRRFGKGTGHPARLNFGDCFSYAYAKLHGMPLLFKGDDFSRTDAQPAS
ncbi:MAG: type II toxin-antitoxin system VapC family toxin [Rhizobiaceae bacterium]|nr:type II toxin-antitoxin system VapC family toxin [Rhizobiaceae bacterium]